MTARASMVIRFANVFMRAIPFVFVVWLLLPNHFGDSSHFASVLIPVNSSAAR
jgi:hypothetical protein